MSKKEKKPNQYHRPRRRPLPVLTCEGCGACCTEQAALPIHLVSDRPDSLLRPVKPLPEELRAELAAIRADMLANDTFPPDGSPCIWYDPEKRECKHYEHRPELCRDAVVVDDQSCRKWRRDKGIDPVDTYSLRNGRIIRS